MYSYSVNAWHFVVLYVVDVRIYVCPSGVMRRGDPYKHITHTKKTYSAAHAQHSTLTAYMFIVENVCR